MTKELHVYVGSNRVGRLSALRDGRVDLEYDAEWQSRSDAYPLSLSMPLTARHHRAAVVEPFLWGLLPDNERILERWAQRFQVSARNAFALLAHVGSDCAGALRILEPSVDPTQSGSVDWLDEAGVAERLRALRADISAWRAAADNGQFSLAGAQPKTALLFDGKRWGVPSGATPTTHILKPGILDLDASAENEHFCLALARELGIPAALSEVLRFEDQIAIVVERYDRQSTDAGIVRVHQEDICQALSVHPANKYENEGGPSARAIVDLLRDVTSAQKEDVRTFLSALIFNWVVAGPDAHAKNYSLLIGAGGQCRLAPLYDLASALPYTALPIQKLKLAMKIGGKYRVRDIGRHQWEKLAGELGLDAALVSSMARDLAVRVPDAANKVLEQLGDNGRHPLLRRLRDATEERAKHCAIILGAP